MDRCNSSTYCIEVTLCKTISSAESVGREGTSGETAWHPDLEEGGEAAGAGGDLEKPRACAIGRAAGHEGCEGHERLALHRVLAAQEQRLSGHLVHSCAALRQPPVRLMSTAAPASGMCVRNQSKMVSTSEIQVIR